MGREYNTYGEEEESINHFGGKRKEATMKT
jgi:hypothetical protein